MFGKKEKEEVKPIYLYSIDNLPGKTYKALGLVISRTTHLGSAEVNNAIHDLQEQARKLNADAIIGFQLATSSGTAGGAMSATIAYGTAIMYTEE